MKRQRDKKPKDRSEDEDFEDEESVQPDEGRDVYAEVRQYASNPGPKYADFSRHNLQEAAARYGDSDPVTLHIYDIGCFCKKMGIALSVTELENLANMRSGRTQAARAGGAEAAQGLSKRDIKDAFGEVLEPVVERLDKLEEHVYDGKAGVKGRSKQKARENQRKMQELEESEAEETEEDEEAEEEPEALKPKEKAKKPKRGTKKEDYVTVKDEDEEEPEEGEEEGPDGEVQFYEGPTPDEIAKHGADPSYLEKEFGFPHAKEILRDAVEAHRSGEDVVYKDKDGRVVAVLSENAISLQRCPPEEPEVPEPKKNGRKRPKAEDRNAAEKAKYESMFKEVSDMGVEITGDGAELSEGYQIGMSHAEKLAKSGNYKGAMDTLASVKQDVENSKAEAAEEEGEEEPEAEEQPTLEDVEGHGIDADYLKGLGIKDAKKKLEGAVNLTIPEIDGEQTGEIWYTNKDRRPVAKLSYDSKKGQWDLREVEQDLDEAEEEPEQPEDNADYKDYEFETVEEAAAFRKCVGRDNCKVLKDGVTIRVGKDGIRKYHFTGKLMKDLKAEAADDEDPDPLASYVVDNAELIKGHSYSFAKNQLFEVEIPVNVAKELDLSEATFLDKAAKVAARARKGKQHEDDADSEVVEDGEDAEEHELEEEEAEEPQEPHALKMPPPRPPRGAPKLGPPPKPAYFPPPPKPGPPPAKAEEEHGEPAGPSTPGPEPLVEFECPLCGANVNYHDEKCGECGAEFEHDEEPPELGTYVINESPGYGGDEVAEIKLNYPGATVKDARQIAEGLQELGAEVGGLSTYPLKITATVFKKDKDKFTDYLTEQGFGRSDIIDEEPVEEVVDEVPEEVTPDEIGAGDIDEEFAEVEKTAPTDESKEKGAEHTPTMQPQGPPEVPPPGPPTRAPQAKQDATKEPDVADVDKDLDKLLEGLDEPSDDDLERKRKSMNIDRAELEMAMKAKRELHDEKMEDKQQDHEHRMEEHKAGMPVAPPAQEQPREGSLDHIMKNLKKGNGSKGTTVTDSVVIKSDLPGPVEVDGQSIVKGKTVAPPEEKQEKTGVDASRDARKKAKQKAKKGA